MRQRTLIRVILAYVLCCMPLLASAAGTPQNDRTGAVKITVTDDLGAVPGVSIQVKGSIKGTVTDLNGAALLEDVPTPCTLTVTCLGYISQEIPFNGQQNISITLAEDTQKLEEVVVVGYATQKKVNLSGSVSAINIAEITESRPVVNISNALSGMAAGVNVRAGSNQPSSNDATIRVRGIGTLNSAGPLVLIDGVEGSYNSVAPHDVESISVLKDAASAAIYGSRAANGVILITTKQGGRGKVKVEYNGYVSLETARIAFNPVSDYADYMEYMNFFYEGEDYGPYYLYSQKTIDEWRANNDPQLYPNTNWVKELFRPAVSQNHTLSVSGGNEKTRSFLSFTFNDNPGIMENSGQRLYSFRANVENKPTNWLTLGANINGSYTDTDMGASYTQSAINKANNSTPGYCWRSEDGRYGSSNNFEDPADVLGNNPLRILNQHRGYNHNYKVRTKFFGTVSPFDGMKITASFTNNYTNHQTKNIPVMIDLWNFHSGAVVNKSNEESQIKMANTQTSRQLGEVLATYNHKFFDERLDFTVLAGASQEQYRTEDYSSLRKDLIDNSFSVFDAATGECTIEGNSSEWAMRSYFGRINLALDNKYLLEANFRADGSSRFLGKNRWGYFPSASVAWRLSQEDFMRNSGVDELKIRASFGGLGNNSVGNYEAQTFYSTQNYSLADKVVVGTAITGYGNSALTWETTYVANLGVDFGLFKNRLTGIVDVFDKVTKNILIELPAPIVHGSSDVPTSNAAQVSNKGFEITLGWKDRIGKFHYSIDANFTHIKNNVDKYRGLDENGNAIFTLRENNEGTVINYIGEGAPVDAQYLLKVDRIVQTEEDLKLIEDMLAANPKAFDTYGKPELGDLLYKDLNGDGLLNESDRTICSDGPNPKFYYGATLACGWKGFDFSMLLQGSYGMKMFLLQQGFNTPTFNEGHQLNQTLIDKAWKPGMTDATYPRMVFQKDRLNTQYCDQYLEDMSYLKIRNIQLGYSLPSKVLNSVKIEKLRVYASLENFFTFTNFIAFDPEVYGMSYPSIRQAVFGINVTF